MLSSTVSTFCGASIAHRRPLHVRRLRMARCHVAHAIAKLAPPVDAIDDDERAHMTRRSTLFAGVAASVLTNVAPAHAGPVEAGGAAPDFTLTGTDGNVTLSEALKSNEFVVLYFYNQDGSPGCSIEAQRFEAAIPQFTAKKARVVGVSMDSLEKHNEFCSDKGLKSFTLLSDNDGTVSEAYGADLKIPIFGRFSDRQTFLIKKDGTVAAHWLERDSSMASVKTTAHVDQILAAIDAA